MKHFDRMRESLGIEDAVRLMSRGSFVANFDSNVKHFDRMRESLGIEDAVRLMSNDSFASRSKLNLEKLFILPNMFHNDKVAVDEFAVKWFTKVAVNKMDIDEFRSFANFVACVPEAKAQIAEYLASKRAYKAIKACGWGKALVVFLMYNTKMRLDQDVLIGELQRNSP